MRKIIINFQNPSLGGNQKLINLGKLKLALLKTITHLIYSLINALIGCISLLPVIYMLAAADYTQGRVISSKEAIEYEITRNDKQHVLFYSGNEPRLLSVEPGSELSEKLPVTILSAKILYEKSEIVDFPNFWVRPLFMTFVTFSLWFIICSSFNKWFDLKRADDAVLHILKNRDKRVISRFTSYAILCMLIIMLILIFIGLFSLLSLKHRQLMPLNVRITGLILFGLLLIHIMSTIYLWFIAQKNLWKYKSYSLKG